MINVSTKYDPIIHVEMTWSAHWNQPNLAIAHILLSGMKQSLGLLDQPRVGNVSLYSVYVCNVGYMYQLVS